MKHFARFLALLLACLTLVTMVVACDQTSDGGNNNNGGGSSSNVKDDTLDINGRLKDNLPNDLNYGGEEIVIGASFRDPVTGLTADMEELFRVDYTKSREGYHYIQSVTARDGRRISAVPPMLELQLPDPRFS